MILRERNEKDEAVSSCTQQPPVRCKSRAEYQRQYRQKIKESGGPYYRHFRDEENTRTRIWRENRSAEGQANDRELSRIRMARYRQRRKDSGLPNKSATGKTCTRAERVEQRAKWRQQKKTERLNMSSQKRRRINEKRRQRYANQKAKKCNRSAASLPHSENVPSTSTPNQVDDTEPAFSTECAKRKALSRSWRILPKDPEKFAEVLSAVITSATPKKKSALRKRIIFSPAKKKKLDVLERNSIKKVIQEIRRSRSQRDNEIRRVIHAATVVKSNLKKRIAVKEMGFSWNFLTKVPTVGQIRKMRKDALNPDVIRKVTDFYNRGDVSRELPMTKSTSSQKVLECSTAYAYKLFKEESPDVNLSFSKFQKLRPANMKPMSKSQLLQCLCEYCINMKFMLETVKHQLISAGVTETISDKYSASDITLCQTEEPFPQKDCVDRICQECGVANMKEHLRPLMVLRGQSEVRWKSWEMTSNEKGKRMTLLVKSGKLTELVDVLMDKLEPFSKHLANAKWQATQFANIRHDVPLDWTVFCMDFGENFNCHFQDEAQSAHWAYKQATIHPIVAYYKCLENGCDTIVHESLMFISDDKTHDHHAVQHFVMVATDHLKRRGVRSSKQVHFTDGSGAQYKNKSAFYDASLGLEELGCTVEKHFFGSRHGKGPCDGEIGVLKRCAATAVKGRQVIIADAHDLFKYGRDYLTLPLEGDAHVHSKRTFFMVRDGEVQRDVRKEEVERSHLKAVPKTRKSHSFIGVKPSVVTVREMSCFCDSCVAGDYNNCKELPFVGASTTYSLQSGKQILTGDKTPSVDTPSTSSFGDLPQSFEKLVASVVDLPSPDGLLDISDITLPSDMSSISLPLTMDPMSTSLGLIAAAGFPVDLLTNLTYQPPSNDLQPSATSSDQPIKRRDSKDEYTKGGFAAIKVFGSRSCSIFMAEIVDYTEDKKEVHVRFMKKCGENLYVWPTPHDQSWEPRGSFVCAVGYPELANKREQFKFHTSDILKIKQIVQSSFQFE